MPQLVQADFAFVDTAIGGPSRRNNVQRLDELRVPPDAVDAYVGMFRFPEAYLLHCRDTGSVSGMQKLPCYSDYLWFDIDREELAAALADTRQLVSNLDRIVAGLSELAVVYFSGAKGFHVGIPMQLFGAVPDPAFPQQMRRVAEHIARGVTIDSTIYERNRLLRAPNTRHGESGLYKTPLTIEEIRSLTIDEIVCKARQPQGESLPPIVAEGQFDPRPACVALWESLKAGATVSSPTVLTDRDPEERPSISTILDGLADGNRNSSFCIVIGRLHYMGVRPEDIQTLLLPHAIRTGFPEQELWAEVQGICRRYPSSNSFPILEHIYTEKSETKSPALVPIPLRDLLANTPSEIEWLVDQLFPMRSVSIVAGPAGVGKSWLLMDLAVSCATGRPFLRKFPTRKGSVLYIDEESDAGLIGNRFRKLLRAADLPDDLDIKFLVGNGLKLTDARFQGELFDLLERTRPDVVFFDSLIRLHRAEENSATDMARVFEVVKEIVRRFGCVVVFADHHRKPGLYDRSPENQLRGTTEKVAFVDALLSLRPVDSGFSIEHSKSRFGQPIEPLMVRLEEPIKGLVWLNVVGDLKDYRSAEKAARSIEFLMEEFEGGDWHSRPKLLAAAEAEGIRAGELDCGLKELLRRDTIEKDVRPSEGKRGGKTAYYRLKSKLPDDAIDAKTDDCPGSGGQEHDAWLPF